jgi:glycogen operon protein
MPGGRPRFGASVGEDGIRFAVWSGSAARLFVSIFDGSGEVEVDRLELERDGSDVFSLHVSGLRAGTKYGFRADGAYAPERGLWFDPDKLLVDPWAVELDRPFRWDGRLSAPRGSGGDTAPLVPKAIAREPAVWAMPAPPLFRTGGLVYEVPVKAFTIRHPAVGQGERGTIAALMHPAIIEHLRKLGVAAVELMPVAAWIDERHLPALGLSNAWGYNPVTFMALDPRLAPGGLQDLQRTVSALHAAGIAVILDVVFNHTGEGDELGPTLSLRGLDSPAYYRHQAGVSPARLVNDTGTGNTLACDNAIVQELVMDSLRHFVLGAGVDGFRFDLAPVLGRSASGFDPDASLLSAMRTDPVLGDRIMIAEPWDIGPGGYQTGNFPENFLEWNDRFRDDVRRFWRGDDGTIGTLATRLAGSSDIFGRSGSTATRSVNFVAAHDGFPLADLMRYERKHNDANGEQNRDGHNDNFSWNCGVEGETDDAGIIHTRRLAQRALLATLFASRGTPMLAAGDEFGRSQGGNNNAYAQDNETAWLDWEGRDVDLEGFVARLAALRAATPALAEPDFLAAAPRDAAGVAGVAWLTERGEPLEASDWDRPERRRLTMLIADGSGNRFAVLVNGDRRGTAFALPGRAGFGWAPVGPEPEPAGSGYMQVAGRSVAFAAERPL